MTWLGDPAPATPRWHTVGLTAYLCMLGLYAAAGRHVGGADVDVRLYWWLAGAALIGATAAVAGRLRGWQLRRDLLIGWPVASLAATTVVGAVDPDATRLLPGTITITFVYVGLTCPRLRSLVLVPLGVAAFVVGGVKQLPGELPTVAVTATMWVLVAEVPAWLISRLEAQSALLRRIAHTDALTQLFDRSTLEAQLAAHAGSATVVLIDLDHFKRYNDTHGHAAGDDLLVSFADALRGSAGMRDMVFRIGGDEFLILIVGGDSAQDVLDRLHRRWREAGAPVSFSAGVATGAQDLMRIADERMYAAKRSRGPS